MECCRLIERLISLQMDLYFGMPYFRMPLLSIGNLLWGCSKIGHAQSEIRQALEAVVILSIGNLLVSRELCQKGQNYGYLLGARPL